MKHPYHRQPHDQRSRHSSGGRGVWQVARGLLAMAGLAAVIGGTPWALLRFTDWPITGVPTWGQIGDFPAVAAEDATIIAVFVVGIWIAWAVFVACVAVEVIGEIRGTAATRLPAAGPLQHAARTLVASVAMTFGSLGSLAPAGAAEQPTPVHSVAAAEMAATPVAVADDPVVLVSPSVPGQRSTVDHEQPVAWEMVRVDDGDSAWELAERHYGDGTAWLRLWEDNKNQTQPDGRRWAAQTDPIEPGWVLRVRASEPVDAPTPTGHDGTAGADGEVGETHDDRGGSPEPADPSPSGSGTVEVTVQPGDSLWGLAEDRLADTLGRPAAPAEVGPYWTRVVDANHDRLVAPGDPDLIFSGQQVRLPALDETAPPTETHPPAAPSPGPPPTQPPESPPSTPRLPDTSTPPVATDADVTGTGATAGHEPPMPSTTAPSAPSAPGTTVPGSPSGEPATAAPATDQDEGDDDGALSWHVIGAYSAVGVALSVGVTRAIQRRRRRRNHLHPHSAPRPSDNPDLHRDLIVAADDDAFEQLRAALGHLAIGVAELGARCRPRVVQNNTDHIEVLLDTPTPTAPADWHARGGGAVWSCDPHRLITIGHDNTSATPLLVTLGQPDHGGQLYIDLEAEGLIGLVGDTHVARDTARAIISELAHSPLADGAQVVVVGDLVTPSLGRLDRVTVIDDWDTAVDNLLEWAGQSHNALVANGWPNAFVARGLGADHDALIPLVVVTTHPPDPDDLDRLRALDPRAVALIVVGDAPEGATVIDCAPGRLTLADLGLVCAPQTVDDHLVEAIADLLDDATKPSGEQLELLPALPAPPAEPDTTATATATGNGGTYQDPPYEILIRVLGDITIEGNPSRLTPKQTSVVTYIAVHRTVTAARAADALWPAPTKTRRRQLSNVVSDCRNALGGRHLPIAADGRYRAGPGLLTDLELFQRRVTAAAHQPPDLELFQRRVTAAAHQPPDLAIETLRGAIDLARGPIFTYPGGDKKSRDWAWIALEDWHSIWEQKITAAARALIDLYLAAGDTQQAVEVAEHTRQIIPTDTDLTERLMRAHAANGNFTAVRRVYIDHVEALAHYGIDDPAESTTTLYEDLLGGPR